MSSLPTPIARTQRGFSLIEVLVTMLLLSFGLLGVAGLLVKGLSNSAASESASKANQLLADMADRIRVNSAMAIAASPSIYDTSWGTEPGSITGTTTAETDKKAWLVAIRSQLPMGDGKITRDRSDPNKFILEVSWSVCFGTLSDTERASCAPGASSSAAASSSGSRGDSFKVMSMEVRL